MHDAEHVDALDALDALDAHLVCHHREMPIPNGPIDVEAELEAALALAQADNPRGALARLSAVFAVEPDHAEASMVAAAAHLALSELKLAEAAIDRALQSAPDSAPALMISAQVALRRGETKQATERARDSLARDPDDVDQRYQCAFILHQAGEVDAAVDALEQLIRDEPTYGSAFEELSHAYIDQHRFDDALAMALEALRCEPLDARAHIAKARALHGLGRTREARDAARQARALAPHDTWVHTHAEAIEGLGGSLVGLLFRLGGKRSLGVRVGCALLVVPLALLGGGPIILGIMAVTMVVTVLVIVGNFLIALAKTTFKHRDVEVDDDY